MTSTWENGSGKLTECGHHPAIFIGYVRSGNTVMKSGEDRDHTSAKHGFVAVEMEGIVSWDEVPCILIEGICDYSDRYLFSTLGNKFNRVTAIFWLFFAARYFSSVLKSGHPFRLVQPC